LAAFSSEISIFHAYISIFHGDLIIFIIFHGTTTTRLFVAKSPGFLRCASHLLLQFRGQLPVTTNTAGLEGRTLALRHGRHGVILCCLINKYL
jgi:hypothetical protein